MLHEKFLRRIQLKAFFHDKEDNSNASDKDIFETLHVHKSKWTPILILISLTILKNTCLSAAFPYVRVSQTAAKT